MEVRITFRSEVIIKGDNLAEIRDKFEEMTLFSEEANKYDAAYMELVSVEDNNTYEDLESKYWHAVD